MLVLAIDPGTDMSAYSLISEDYKIIDKNKVVNEDLLKLVIEGNYDELVIEGFESFGMGVGATVFDTAYFIGRVLQKAEDAGKKTHMLYRKEIKMNICQTTRAKDTNIRIALIDRFAKHDKVRGKGTKNNKDWFYGFAADMWSSYAIGTTWIDMQKGLYK